MRYIINFAWHSTIADRVLPLFRYPLFWTPVYAFLAFIMPKKYKMQGLWWCLFFVLTFAITDYVSASVLKPFFHRFRPCHNPSLATVRRLLVDCGGEYGFPSSHASNHFGMAWYAIATLGNRYKWVLPVALAWAALVAYSQVYVGVHYPADVACGAILGTMVGCSTGFLFNNYFGLEAKTKLQQ
ncbi:MAG: phosphatase PAP2 family protein [Chitinophagia bacterium]|nr:phosphatase PAP2 family protein [Chitinophagia bacterium]